MKQRASCARRTILLTELFSCHSTQDVKERSDWRCMAVLRGDGSQRATEGVRSGASDLPSALQVERLVGGGDLTLYVGARSEALSRLSQGVCFAGT